MSVRVRWSVLVAAGRAAGRRVLAGAGAGALAVVVGTALDAVLARVGATHEEVTAVLPGDELLPDADVVSTRAITIDARPVAVWPWLVQIGWGRAGWYSLDLVERPLGAARSVAQDGSVSWRSLDHVAIRHQRLAVGDLVPLGDGFGFRVAVLEEPRHLVLELDRLLSDEVRLRWTWALRLREADGRTRLVARTSMAATPSLLGPLLLRPLLGAGHAVMELAQLRGIRDRVEATP